MREKWLVVCLIYVMCLSACGTNKNHNAETRKIEKAVENEDAKEMEAIVLGTEDFVTYEDGTFTAVYLAKKFVNGLTGNLIVSYQELV